MPPDIPKVNDEPRRVSGEILERLRQWYARFIIPMHDHDLDLLVLWVAHTHLCEVTYTSPRLLLDSPVPGSGKTTVLEHIERTARWPIQMASVSSPSLLTRLLTNGIRTILIDEADRSLDPKKEGVGELVAVLNSGYKKGASRPVLVKDGNDWRPVEMSTFAPVVMAGNSPQLADDTRSRCIRVLLMPDVHGEAEDSDWELYDANARTYGKMLEVWATGVRDQVRTSRPELPEGIRGRMREKWAPLKRIADAAGGRWPALVDQLALQDLEQLRMDREDGMLVQKPHVILLTHLAEVWPADEQFMQTRDLVPMLIERHPEMWGETSSYPRELTPQRFGRMLVTHFGVNSTRPERNGPRGYTRAALAGPWRHLGIEPEQPEQAAQPEHEPDPAPVAPVRPVAPVQPDTPPEPAPQPDRPSATEHLDLDNLLGVACAECGYRTGHKAGCNNGRKTA